MGKTTVLRAVSRDSGGVLIGVREFLACLNRRSPSAFEEACADWIESALARAGIVLVDDLHLVRNVADSCDYPRGNLLDLVLTAVLAEAASRGQKLVFAHSGVLPDSIARVAVPVRIRNFAAADYEAICRGYMPDHVASRLDYGEIYRFAPSLNAYQLKNASAWLSRGRAFETDRFTRYLAMRNLASNVEIKEVEPVSWNALRGVDEVIRALEAKVALPFEQTALASELNLRPKRGVLLAGPPGTGKTTIGRALAHRLKSKFFLIDGTMIAGSRQFYQEVDRVFNAAKRNAPAIVFIDDADVIFRGEEEHGLYRYLLTMMDGLENASTGRVCVMLTAMDAASLPAALLRSGRVELWLETGLPDETAREVILRDRLAGVPPPIGCVDVRLAASASAGLTGADLKAIVEDAKLLYAHDRAMGKPPRPPEEYLLDAIETVRKNRRNYVRRKPAPWAEVKFGYKIT